MKRPIINTYLGYNGGTWLNTTQTYPHDAQIVLDNPTLFTDVNTDQDTDDLTAGEMAFSRDLATAANVPMTTQVLRLTYFTASKDETVNSARIISGATAATATPSLVRIGVYTEAANGDLTLVASTPNDTALLATINTVYTKALSAPLTKTSGRRYAVGVLVVSAVAMPTLVGYAYSAGITVEMFASPKACAAVNGNADLPATILNASILNSGNRIYAALIQ